MVSIMLLIQLFQCQVVSMTIFDKYAHENSVIHTFYAITNYVTLNEFDQSIIRIFLISTLYLIFIIKLILVFQIPGKLINSSLPYIVLFTMEILYALETIFEYILLIPLQYSLMRIYFCDDFEKYFTVEHSIWLGIAIISQIIFVVFVIINKILNTDNNPESKSICASYDGITNYIRLILQTSIPIIYSVGEYAKNLKTFTIIISGFAIIALITRWIEGGNHQLWTNSFHAFQEIFTCATHMGSFALYFLDDTENIFYISTFVSLPLIFAFISLNQWNINIIVNTKLPVQQKTLNHFEIYLYNIMKCFKKNKNIKNSITISHTVMLHNQACTNNNCLCSELLTLLCGRSSKAKKEAIDNHHKNDHSGMINDISRLLALLLKEASTKFHKSSEFDIQLSYYYLSVLENPYMSLYYIKNANTFSPRKSLQYQIFKQICNIEIVLSKELDSHFAAGLNILLNIHYTHLTNTFQEAAEICVINHQYFWNNLLGLKPDITKLINYGQQISDKMEIINKTYRKLLNINCNDGKVLHKYAMIIKNVMHDEIETDSILAKLNNIKNIKNEGRWNCWENNIGLMRVSGDKASLCKIKDVNEICENILEYNKKELIGTNCSRIMLPMIAQNHNKWVLNFYELMKRNKLNTFFDSFLLKSNGCYEQYKIIVMSIPILQDMVQEFLVLFKNDELNLYLPSYLRKLKPMIFLCDENHNIIGMNEICKKFFKIPIEESDRNFHECNLLNIFPQLATTKNEGVTFKSSPNLVYGYILGELSNAIIKIEDIMSANDCTELWGQLIKETYGKNSDIQSTLNIGLLIPLNRFFRRSLKDNNTVALKNDENTPALSSDLVSTNTVSNSNCVSQAVKEFKLKLYERSFPKIVTYLRFYIIILGVVLFLGSSMIFNIYSCEFDIYKFKRKEIVQKLYYTHVLYRSILRVHEILPLY